MHGIFPKIASFWGFFHFLMLYIIINQNSPNIELKTADSLVKI